MSGRTDPSGFVNPHSRANRLGRLLWAFAYHLLFRPTPARLLVGWRNWLLRLFGARLGKVWFHPSVRIWAPWLLEAGDDVYIAEGVHLYNAFGIRIGNRVVISLRTFLCSASHDHTRPTYPLTGGRIEAGDDSWIAAEVFVGPGVRIGDGAVIAARSVLVGDAEPWTVYAGHPARPLKAREIVPDSPE